MENKIFDAKTLNQTTKQTVMVAKENIKKELEEEIKNQCLEEATKNCKYQKEICFSSCISETNRIKVSDQDIEEIFEDIKAWLKTQDFIIKDGTTKGSFIIKW